MFLPQFTRFPQLKSFCTTREGGFSRGAYASFNQSPYSGDNPADYLHNRQKLCETIGITADRLVIPFQTHEDKILVIDEDFLQKFPVEQAEILHGIDGLITKIPGVCIGVTTADCVPITLYDSRQEVVSVLHAGWRGTRRRITEKAVRVLSEQFGTCPADIYAVIGPSISQANYQVGEELVDEFEAGGFPTDRLFSRQNDSLHLDLWEANRWLLNACGVPENQIEITNLCTYSEPERFFSARRLGIESGRMLSGVMLLK